MRANEQLQSAPVSTRYAIVYLLKQVGASDAQTLAECLSISDMAVRQHLYALHKENLVIYTEEPRPQGRPAKLWQLTTQADHFFPDGYAQLTLSLINSMTEAFGDEGLERLLEVRTKQQQELYEAHIRAKDSVEQRVAVLAQLRTQEGYMATVEHQPDGSIFLVENHCPIGGAATACTGFCHRELELFQRFLGEQVKIERTEHIITGARRCAYKISSLSGERYNKAVQISCDSSIPMPAATKVKTEYEAIIGLETHCQLSTKTKIFSSISTEFGSPPNTNVSPICLGYPGVLPVLNEKVLEYAVKAGIALNCTIAPYSKFDRKQYFYPDLPKNYQISQYDLPIAEHGWLEIELADKKTGAVTRKKIGITRLHMEEDAGKLVHVGSDRLSGSTESLVDFNRAGIPLIEIVSEPDLRSGQEAAEYAQELRRIVRYLGVSDGNMQEGSLRCDVNISVRPVGQKEFGTKVEIKNMNSFSAIQKAIEYEIERQTKAVQTGEPIVQETRLWEEGSGRTISMRSKEGSSDYRYFPEPDLPPIEVSSKQLEEWKAQLPELPAQKRHRYEEKLGLSAYDARVLTDDSAVATYFEATVATKADAKQAANWIMGDISAYLNNNKLKITEIALKPKILAELITLIDKGTISGKIAKEILPELLTKGGSAKKLVEKKGLTQISDSGELEKIIESLLAAHPKEVEQFRNGKTKLKGFFVGQVMKQTSGRADPKLVNQLLAKKLPG